jgi:hypothetical protein
VNYKAKSVSNELMNPIKLEIHAGTYLKKPCNGKKMAIRSCNTKLLCPVMFW